MGWLLLGDAGARVLGQGAIVVTARVLGPKDYGAFAVGLAVLAILLVLADLGVGDAAVRDLTTPTDGRSAFLRDVAPLRLALSLPFAVIGGLAFVLASGTVAHTVWLAFLTLPLAVLAMGAAQEARIVRDFRRSSMWSTALLLSQWLGGALGAVLVGSAEGAMLGVLACLLVTAAPLHRVVPAVFRPTAAWRRWVTRARPFLITSASVALYSRGDRLILALLAGASAAGPYVAAYSIVMAAALVGSAVHAAILPRLLDEYSGSGSTTWARRTSLLAAWLVPLAVAVFFSANWVVLALYGPAYSTAIQVLQALSPLMILYVINPVLSSHLIAADRQHALARIAFGNLCTAALLYPLFILKGGAVGAALASVLIESLGFIAMVTALQVRKGFDRPAA